MHAISRDGAQSLVESRDGEILKRVEGISVSHNFIAQIWRDHDLQPQRQGTFKLSNDPDFEAKVADVVGLYLDPPMRAVGVVDRREDPGAGPGPDTAGAADRLRQDREAHP